ncbi:helix-turn-helix domain-containing protein [Burkholderia cepacia]|uniref:helix-turn-helix domain-containing protein n=1 Tax=Burkholderia cepacia TaxID=292 RepID=UPI000757C592|nr:helix-turn-helix domain-containing protein [Burkholderia cepacia]KVX59327.1 hypothetical protein WL06_05855 [Burkholderia cepacia]KWD63389.1 hypothetical protein WL68_00480 [Burkholderia cepacia]KWD84417.1 hypothetical protein WL69_12735 [Burkholderia cepacia]
MNVTKNQTDLHAPLFGGDAKSVLPVESAFSYPEKGSVRARILAALLRGDALTQHAALRRWSTSRLASAVHQLRGFGWPIMTVPVPVQTRDNGRTATIARYKLPAFAIEKAGERGQQFVAHAEQCEKRGTQR